MSLKTLYRKRTVIWPFYFYTIIRTLSIYRPDVNQAYNTLGNVGYHVSFNMRDFPNKKVYVMMRATNDPEGNTKGGAQDFHDKRWYLNIPQR
ncbi:N-acetylmuramoyl-L-alanine amidase [Enterococcus faecium]|uniref:N-acetylmuramoyl-L-alanine amidase n=1 Tax=Enterococcus faecium TaxID=1352 RepID=UPI001F05BFEE|nr:N-acetylmuramoyl-L-alanine amidase [Enterococcus faecium]